ncbi:MAG: SDR family oxidoreductase [Bacillota bacterium]|nr:SDR family oxidoreductase [Bacillota bacterium]
MKSDLRGKVCLITGAGQGIGRAIALELAKEGVNLVICGRNIDKLRETQNLVSGFSKCYILEGDLLDENYRRECIPKAANCFGGLDILINNAGIAQSRKFEEITEKEYDLIMETNAKVPFMLCQAALPYLRNSNCPTIINIASVTAHKGYPLQSVYSASKHALLGFTKSLANEVYTEGIRVHAVSPGGVYTDMIKISRPDLSSEGMIMPEDVADAVLYLLLHRGNAVTDEIQIHRSGKAPF